MAKKQAQNPAVIDSAPAPTLGTDLTKAAVVAPVVGFDSSLLNPIYKTIHHEIDGCKTPKEIAEKAAMFYAQSEGVSGQVRKHIYMELAMRVAKEPVETRDAYAGQVVDELKIVLVIQKRKGADARASELRSFTKAYRINPKATTALFETEGYTGMIEKARKLTEAATDPATKRKSGGGGSGNKAPSADWMLKIRERILKSCTMEQCYELQQAASDRLAAMQAKIAGQGVQTGNIQK